MEAGANLNAVGRDGQQPLHLASLQGDKAILELILRTGKCSNLYMVDASGMTPLRLACAGDDDEGEYNEVIRLLLNQIPELDMDEAIQEMKSAVEVAFENDHNERGETILDVFDQETSWPSNAFMWAAGEAKRHKIAAFLVKKRLQIPVPIDSEGWTAIQWAAFATEPQALWLLIANSPQSNETKEALKSAKGIVEKLKNKNLDKLDVTEARKTQDVRDIIHNPPTGLLCETNSSLRRIRPKFEQKHVPLLERYEATIVQFYERDSTFDSIMRSQAIKETVYGQGPVKIMDETIKKLRELAKLHSSGLVGGSDFQRPILVEPKPEPQFTWIHLPATNMIWMDDLLETIMVDAGGHDGHYHQLKSFFKNSWIELPDRVSASRFMRPQFVSCNTRGKVDHTANQDQNSMATAIYMPYLTYSFQYGGERNDDEAEDTVIPMSSQSPEQLEQKPAITEEATSARQKSSKFEHRKKTKYDKTEEKELEYAKTLKETKRLYMNLLDEYDGKVIHGSSTLDESYYHFGKDPQSTEDKAKRNESQVVTEIWREQTDGPTWHDEKLGSYWLLVRVNQLWVWTINNKWLISASSHPIDDSENELLGDILDLLEKEREAAGSDLQQVSTSEMSHFIVDYCINSYERKPDFHHRNRPEACRLTLSPSIRQAFSKSINSIARDETNLFDKFRRLRMRLREKPHRNSSNHSKPVPDIIRDKELTGATSEAERLSRRVKDVLDELSMLEATVQYQQDVQKAMRKKKVQREDGKHKALETDLTATYIIDDIKRLTSVAERAHMAVNTTLSLHQNEIANLQTELTIQDGKVLMVFTVVTILFLPLSFMTSFFALDVASFQQAPPWSIGVIFAVSFGLFIPMVIVAFSWKRSKDFVVDLMPNLIRHAKERLEQSIPDIKKLSRSSDQTQNVNDNSDSGLGTSEVPLQVTPRERSGLCGLPRFRRKRNNDLEIGDN